MLPEVVQARKVPSAVALERTFTRVLSVHQHEVDVEDRTGCQTCLTWRARCSDLEKAMVQLPYPWQTNIFLASRRVGDGAGLEKSKVAEVGDTSFDCGECTLNGEMGLESGLGVLEGVGWYLGGEEQGSMAKAGATAWSDNRQN
jgi:hypothetical protein